jgi:hypothetical protein
VTSSSYLGRRTHLHNGELNKVKDGEMSETWER